jgi:hypothetical protein
MTLWYLHVFIFTNTSSILPTWEKPVGHVQHDEYVRVSVGLVKIESVLIS